MLGRFLNPITERPRFFAALLGIACTLGLAPLFLWPVSLVAIGGLYLLVHDAPDARSAALLGFIFGIFHHLSGLYWLPQTFAITYGTWQSVWLIGVGSLLLLSMYLAIFIALPCYLLQRLAPFHAWSPVLFALLWVVGEALRASLFSGFPWNLTGYIFADNIIMMQGASFGGIWFLSFLAVFVAASLTRTMDHFFVAVSVLIIMVYLGWWNSTSQAVSAGASYGSVRLIHSHVPQEKKWDPFEAEKILKDFTHITKDSLHTPAEYVIWPETAVPYFLEDDHAVRDAIAEQLAPDQKLITGTIRRLELGRETFFNSIISIEPDASISSMYDKKNLVPFGEYVPMRGLMPSFVQKMVHGRADYSPGVGPALLELSPGLHAISLVCYEAIFPQFVATYAADAQLILNITNDAWFAGTTAPAQHYAMARIRAVETGLPLIRVANGGISAIVAPNGTELLRIDSNYAIARNGRIPPKAPQVPTFSQIFSEKGQTALPPWMVLEK